MKSHPSWPLPGPAILCIALVTESYSLCSLKVSLHHTLNIIQPTNHALRPATLSCPPKVLPSHRLLHLRSSSLEDQAVTSVRITPGGEASGFFSSFTSQSTQAMRLSMAQSTLHPWLPSLIKWGVGSAPSEADDSAPASSTSLRLTQGSIRQREDEKGRGDLSVPPPLRHLPNRSHFLA